MKICPSLVLITVSLICSIPVYGNESRENKNKPSDINYITPEYYLSKKGEKFFSLEKSLGWSQKNWKKFHGKIALVLMIDKDGKASLNPQNKGQWSIHTIDLNNLDLNLAKQILGKPVESTDEIKIFDLVTSSTKTKKTIYHLDALFTDDKLSSYRVRGIGIKTPIWQKI